MSDRTLRYMRAGSYACFLLIGLLALTTTLMNGLSPKMADQGLWLRYQAPVNVLAASALLVGLVLTLAARVESGLLVLCCANLVPPLLTVLEVTVPGSVARGLWIFQVLSDVAFPLRWFLVTRVRASH
jgi:hypothetical protein